MAEAKDKHIDPVRDSEFICILQDMKSTEYCCVCDFEAKPRLIANKAKEIYKEIIEDEEPEVKLNSIFTDSNETEKEGDEKAIFAATYLLALFDTQHTDNAEIVLHELHYKTSVATIAYIILCAIRLRGGEMYKLHSREIRYVTTNIKEKNKFLEEIKAEMNLYDSKDSPYDHIDILIKDQACFNSSKDKEISLYTFPKPTTNTTESLHDTPRAEKNVDIFKQEVSKYGFFELEKIKCLGSNEQEKLSENICNGNYIYQTAALYALGYIDNLRKYKEFKTTIPIYNHIGKIANTHERRIQDYLTAKGPKEGLYCYIKNFEDFYSNLVSKSTKAQTDENQQVRKIALKGA